MSIKSKKGMTLVELVITIAVTAIVLAEISTFIVFLHRQTTGIKNQEEAYMAITTVKELIASEFNNNDKADIDEAEKTRFEKNNDNYKFYIKDIDSDEMYNDFVVKNNYDEYIKNITFEPSIDLSDSPYFLTKDSYVICKIEYTLNNNSGNQFYSFVLVKHF